MRLLPIALVACGAPPAPPEQPHTESPPAARCSLSGKVTLDGVGVPYFGVTLTNKYKGQIGRSPVEVRNGTGHFCIASKGLFDVVIAGPGFARRVIRDVMLPRDLGTIEVDRGGVVDGHVRDELGAPVPNVQVRLSPGLSESLDRNELDDLALNIHHATTDIDGHYEITGVSANDWDDDNLEISVVTGSRSTGRRRVRFVTSTIELALRPVGGVDIEVVGDYASATIQVIAENDHDNWLTGEPDEHGHVRISDVPEGSYLVTADTRRSGTKIAVTANQVTTTTITLP